MTDNRAQESFRFVSCMELREILGKRAMDEARLIEIIEEAPPDSIYYHTHSYYLRHAYIQGVFPNDFATWVALHAQDRVLGERLGVLDPFDFDDIESVRSEILTIMGDHLNHIKTVPVCTTGEPFEFVRSHVIEADLDLQVWTLREFRDGLARVDMGAIFNHVCEARLRKGRAPGDFASWIGGREGLGRETLAEDIVKVGRLGLSLEGMRGKILQLCDQALATA